MATTKIPAIRFSQDGVTMFVSAGQTSLINQVGTVDIWDPNLDDEDPDQGYQREIIAAHVRRIARFLLEPQGLRLMPTSVVLSSRGALRFEPMIIDGQESSFGWLHLDEPLYKVDGMHRTEGFKAAAQEDETLNTFQLPVVIMEDIEKVEEIRQFYTVNATPKRVRTDLADRLLKAMGHFDTQASGWRKKALEVVDKLRKWPNGPWEGRIKLPNALSGIVSQRSFTESLKPVFDGVLQGQSSDTVASALNNYWQALRNLMPDAFEEPKNYVLQKSIGVFAWNKVAAHVFVACLRGGNDFSVEKMEKILSQVGDYTESGFWYNKKHGGEAPNYSGMAGFAALAQEIIDSLPDSEVVINV